MSKITQQEIATPQIANSENLKKIMLSPTRRITYCATFIAAAFLFKVLSNYTMVAGFRLSLVYIPWVLCAVFMGPFAGAVVGLATDVLGTVILGSTPIPLVILSNTLFPMIIGLLFRYLPLKSAKAKLIIGFSVVIVVCTLTLSTIGQTMFYGTPFWPYLVTFRLPQVAVVVFNMCLCILLLPLMKKMKIIK